MTQIHYITKLGKGKIKLQNLAKLMPKEFIDELLKYGSHQDKDTVFTVGRKIVTK